MIFKIIHSTDYIFDSEVFIEPHYLRFRPRETSYLKVVDFSLTLLSKPVGHRVIQDEDTNVVDFYWFEGVTKQLSIMAESTVETTPYNPFNFILHPPQYNQLPFEYLEEQKKLLFASLEQHPISQALISYGAAIQKASHFNTLSYLTQLIKQIHQDFSVEYRKDGAPLLPDKTFVIKKGSCRDLSWMLINLLRYQGFAARFVSGYFYFEMDEEEPAYELHAWIDVFLPGTGWLGLDPSHGIFTGNTHFPIASSAHFENTMPVSGGIRGSATSQLITQLSIEIL
ncbi:transglutaminase N-terminal domain-containing protein [Aquimarina sp. 2-A2]|uniref:transglutaminase family protein n=1 Tax=Aquimarina sp. 2-A2 TaxID=3382644 RepID=UPI00387F1E0D